MFTNPVAIRSSRSFSKLFSSKKFFEISRLSFGTHPKKSYKIVRQKPLQNCVTKNCNGIRRVNHPLPYGYHDNHAGVR